MKTNAPLTHIPAKLFQLPKNITITEGKNGFGIFALKDFKPGDILYKNYSVMLPNSEEQRVIHFTIPGTQKTLEHMVRIHGVFTLSLEWEYWGFDSCMNHSCLPNTYSYKFADNHYKCIATRNIKANDEITCDYNILYWDYEQAAGKAMQCNCLMLNCQKEIKGFRHLHKESQKMLLPYSQFVHTLNEL
jgi:SET domain